MKNCLLCGYLLLCFCSVKAQTTFNRNTFFVETFGNAISILSLNYERQLKDEPGFGFRIGVGYFGDNEFTVSIPIGINYLINLGRNKSFLETGLGGTRSTAEGIKTYTQELQTGRGEEENLYSFVPSLGFRQHLIKDRLMWRLNFMGIINKYRSFPFVGISAGWRF